MEASSYNIRLATPEDVDQLKRNIKITMMNPEGRSQRKKYDDAVMRNEVLVLTHLDTRTRTDRVEAFLEWHTKIDGTVTIRDAGAIGDEPSPNIIRRLVRELLNIVRPHAATVKVISEQAAWNSVFEDIPGFVMEGREFSRPHWRNVWSWSGPLPTEGDQRGRPRMRPR
jgi:hypothetical protein